MLRVERTNGLISAKGNYRSVIAAAPVSRFTPPVAYSVSSAVL